MALNVIRKDTQFRVEAQGICIDWLPDTPANRKSVVVFLRLLVDDAGQPCFTLQQLAPIVESQNRQAASQHMEDFRAAGCDFSHFLRRKKKVDEQVVEATQAELQRDPLVDVSQLQQRVNARLHRNNLSKVNIQTAMEQISANQIRSVIKSQVACGKAHYREAYLLEEMMTAFSNEAGQRAGIVSRESEGMTLSDPTAIRTLMVPDSPLTAIGSPLKWVVLLMVLYFHGLPLRVLGQWVRVHKTTVLRWILGVSVALWPLVFQFITDRVKASVVIIDEKWIKIRGKWYYWFVVLDDATGLPICASLMASRTQWACRWIGATLKQLGKQPAVIITDGLLSYAYVLRAAKHLHCLFHHQQGVSRWLTQHFTDKTDIASRKPLMKRIFQTPDKRTVKRRFEKLKANASSLSITEWVQQTQAALPKLLPAVGSRRLPSTTNAIERFFRCFNRFYKVRCGFFSVVSAKRELIFFLVMYLFVQQAETGKAPIESILPDARRMPFYQLVNNPLKTVMSVEPVKQKVRLADFQPREYVAIQV